MLLFPFSFLYGLAVFFRNLLYDLNWLPSRCFPVPVICVGNLEMGGSGKTPMMDLLIEHFHKKNKIGCISRGYGRKSKGFVLADDKSDTVTLGDEPFQIFSKWRHHIMLAVDENRARGIENLLTLHPGLNLILMDDGMQHRSVKPSIILMLSPFRNPFYKNFILPFGTLREFRSGCLRARFMIFTKCKEPDERKKEFTEKDLKKRGLPAEHVFLSEVLPAAPLNRNGDTLQPGAGVVAIAGLASNRDFFENVKSGFLVERCISKPDHYRYLPDFFEKEDLNGKVIICPEKDFHKLVCLAPQPEKVFFVPIRNRIFPEEVFWQELEKSIEK